ncbi:hypothetical protein PFNF54_00821, partial [Plasmodium falciparum NF54]
VNTHKKPHTTARHIQTNRLLCECELYMSNYDNDPEMKSVMQQFHDRTKQRFQEYDEMLQEKRQICKDTCDKEIQKIILKDKIEKELNEKFSALHTDIQSDAIPTCICEKSVTDKFEKTCLKCSGIFATAVPELGLIGGTVVYDAAVKAATKAAIKKAIEEVGKIFFLADESTMQWTNMINAGNYSDKMSLVSILTSLNNGCQDGEAVAGPLFCTASNALTESGNPYVFTRTISEKAANAADAARKAASGKFAEMTSVGTIFSDPIVISAIVVISIAENQNEQKITIHKTIKRIDMFYYVDDN